MTLLLNRTHVHSVALVVYTPISRLTVLNGVCAYSAIVVVVDSMLKTKQMTLKFKHNTI